MSFGVGRPTGPRHNSDQSDCGAPALCSTPVQVRFQPGGKVPQEGWTQGTVLAGRHHRDAHSALEHIPGAIRPVLPETRDGGTQAQGACQGLTLVEVKGHQQLGQRDDGEVHAASVNRTQSQRPIANHR